MVTTSWDTLLSLLVLGAVETWVTSSQVLPSEKDSLFYLHGCSSQTKQEWVQSIAKEASHTFKKCQRDDILWGQKPYILCVRLSRGKIKWTGLKI